MGVGICSAKFQRNCTCFYGRLTSSATMLRAMAMTSARGVPLFLAHVLMCFELREAMKECCERSAILAWTSAADSRGAFDEQRHGRISDVYYAPCTPGHGGLKDRAATRAGAQTSKVNTGAGHDLVTLAGSLGLLRHCRPAWRASKSVEASVDMLRAGLQAHTTHTRRTHGAIHTGSLFSSLSKCG